MKKQEGIFRSLLGGMKYFGKSNWHSISTLFFLAVFLIISSSCSTAERNIEIQYTVSTPSPNEHSYHVQMRLSQVEADELIFKMPQWMPGYYQLMKYADDLMNLNVSNEKGESLAFTKVNANTWQISGIEDNTVILDYDILTSRKFVGQSFIDSTHAYILPENTFLYPEGFLDVPVNVSVETIAGWDDIATGLAKVKGTMNSFIAPNYDILYDCPILIGDLDSLESFKVNGIPHYFIGYKIGDFDKKGFAAELKKIVEAAYVLMGDLPYNDYTFLAIGPGRGGIEHLNNTTISFDGNRMNSEEARKQVLSFIAHEYFHHFNVKRIRPFELGPFDYDRANRTNQLWISEGLTVYYEYILLRRAGLVDEELLLKFIAEDMSSLANDSGRKYQSLQQSSYYTWEDGPFGGRPGELDKTISYYQKGPVVGICLDFAIRNASGNSKSLDDVMRYLYQEYYLHQGRGFTEAEFQQVCESLAGAPLPEVFEYVYTTKEVDLAKYLGYAGLVYKELHMNNNEVMIRIERQQILEELQSKMLTSWQAGV